MGGWGGHHTQTQPFTICISEGVFKGIPGERWKGSAGVVCECIPETACGINIDLAAIGPHLGPQSVCRARIRPRFVNPVAATPAVAGEYTLSTGDLRFANLLWAEE